MNTIKEPLHRRNNFTAYFNLERFNKEKQQTIKIMDAAKFHFLSPYRDGGFWQKAKRIIDGKLFVVERFNHGLAHSLRQGALAKDLLEILIKMKLSYGSLDNQELDDLAIWACHQLSSSGYDFFSKVEFASSFQRSGRQSEGSSSHNMARYKQYERQDALNFRKAALDSPLFPDHNEIQIFEEAILWENKGELIEENAPSLKYLRRILHAAHTFDLRRMPGFDGMKICEDALNNLLGGTIKTNTSAHCCEIQQALWKRSGEYLKATGDRDLLKVAKLANRFFYQTSKPKELVKAIYQVRAKKI